MIISLYVAADEQNAIGKGGDLPWRLPEDYKRMVATTVGHPIIMGRKTYESIPEKFRPLKDRQNIVITRNAELQIPGCDVVTSVDEAVELARQSGSDEVFIFGGGEIYAQMMDRADRIYLTRVHTAIDGADTFFPEIDVNVWREVSHEEYPADEKHEFGMTFVRYERM